MFSGFFVLLVPLVGNMYCCFTVSRFVFVSCVSSLCLFHCSFHSVSNCMVRGWLMVCIFHVLVVCRRCCVIAIFCSHVLIVGCWYCLRIALLDGFLVCRYHLGFWITRMLANWNCPIFIISSFLYDWVFSAYVSVDRIIAFRSIILVFI